MSIIMKYLEGRIKEGMSIIMKYLEGRKKGRMKEGRDGEDKRRKE